MPRLSRRRATNATPSSTVDIRITEVGSGTDDGVEMVRTPLPIDRSDELGPNQNPATVPGALYVPLAVGNALLPK